LAPTADLWFLSYRWRPLCLRTCLRFFFPFAVVRRYLSVFFVLVIFMWLSQLLSYGMSALRTLPFRPPCRNILGFGGWCRFPRALELPSRLRPRSCPFLPRASGRAINLFSFPFRLFFRVSLSTRMRLPYFAFRKNRTAP